MEILINWAKLSVFRITHDIKYETATYSIMRRRRSGETLNECHSRNTAVLRLLKEYSNPKHSPSHSFINFKTMMKSKSIECLFGWKMSEIQSHSRNSTFISPFTWTNCEWKVWGNIRVQKIDRQARQNIVCNWTNLRDIIPAKMYRSLYELVESNKRRKMEWKSLGFLLKCVYCMFSPSNWMCSELISSVELSSQWWPGLQKRS